MIEIAQTIAPSIAKYGTAIIADGFTQYPRAVEDYLNSLGLCSTAILLIIILSSYRWQQDQEIYPSVNTLATRLNVSPRRVNQLTAQLCELGLLVKIERFSERSQLSNYYDLEPLYNKVAAWKDPQVAATLAEQERQADEPFEPQDVLEEVAQIISEEFGEPAPRQQRYNAQRIARRWAQHPNVEWPDFADIVEKAANKTEDRAKEKTRTGKAFIKLVPYFFSTLDYWLSKVQPAQQQKTTQPKPAWKVGSLPPNQERGDVKADSQHQKVRAPEALKRCIEAAALTFKDKAVKSSIQRAANIMDRASIDETTMIRLVDEARAATSKAVNVRARMPYFFKLLEARVSTSSI